MMNLFFSPFRAEKNGLAAGKDGWHDVHRERIYGIIKTMHNDLSTDKGGYII